MFERNKIYYYNCTVRMDKNSGNRRDIGVQRERTNIVVRQSDSGGLESIQIDVSD